MTPPSTPAAFPVPSRIPAHRRLRYALLGASVLLAPSGAGKTTTIRMLLGLIAPTAGQARLLGRTLPDPGAVAQTGSMIEEPAFYPWLSGRQNLQGARAHWPGWPAFWPPPLLPRSSPAGGLPRT